MNVYKLEAAIDLNSTEYQKGLKSAGESMAALGSKIKDGAAAIGKATAAGMAAGAAGVAALAKSAVTAYADFEQLEGGVKKLFGTASDSLMSYAEQAYITSGISANEYMEQATSFSASLISSLKGDVNEAAKLTDLAMRSMSDNANTFGTDLSSIQTAYQGFAKEQYQLLDNLKLGYGGT
ncbi:MAG: PblA, partial [Ruminococcus sp.]|nr:PblA [Ruminococcus sp.]